MATGSSQDAVAAGGTHTERRDMVVVLTWSRSAAVAGDDVDVVEQMASGRCIFAQPSSSALSPIASSHEGSDGSESLRGGRDGGDDDADGDRADGDGGDVCGGDGGARKAVVFAQSPLRKAASSRSYGREDGSSFRRKEMHVDGLASSQRGVALQMQHSPAAKLAMQRFVSFGATSPPGKGRDSGRITPAMLRNQSLMASRGHEAGSGALSPTAPPAVGDGASMSLMDSSMHPSRAVSGLSVSSCSVVSCVWRVCTADSSALLRRRWFHNDTSTRV